MALANAGEAPRSCPVPRISPKVPSSRLLIKDPTRACGPPLPAFLVLEAELQHRHQALLRCLC